MNNSDNKTDKWQEYEILANSRGGSKSTVISGRSGTRSVGFWEGGKPEYLKINLRAIKIDEKLQQSNPNLSDGDKHTHHCAISAPLPP